MEMMGLRSAFRLLVLMIFVTWVEVECEVEGKSEVEVESEVGSDCNEMSGTCVTTTEATCRNTYKEHDCNEDQTCCLYDTTCKSNLGGACQSECNNHRIQVGEDCEDGNKCCGCKPSCECLQSYGFSMMKSSNVKCDGETNDTLCEGTDCTCCIPDCPATPDCLSAGGRCAVSCGDGEESHPSIECIKGNNAACLCCVPKKCEKNFWCTISGGQCRGTCDQKSLVVDRTFKCKNGCVCCKPHRLWL